MKKVSPACLAVLCGVLWTGCGYHVGGTADLVPKGIRTISIPPFSSNSTDYKLTDSLPNAIGREFNERTRFQVTTDSAQADAILNGTINRVLRAPSLSDPVTGKTTSGQLIMIMSINLVERTTGKVLYSRPSFVARENYAIATDPHQIFDESTPAMERLAREVARDIVSAVVENF